MIQVEVKHRSDGTKGEDTDSHIFLRISWFHLALFCPFLLEKHLLAQDRSSTVCQLTASQWADEIQGLFEKSNPGVLWWINGLKIWHCHCCDSGHCCYVGSDPGPGTSTCLGHSQKINKLKNKKKKIHVRPRKPVFFFFWDIRKSFPINTLHQLWKKKWVRQLTELALSVLCSHFPFPDASPQKHTTKVKNPL